MSRPLRIGVDARELQGRPTGTGRYLRSLLRHWTRGDDERRRRLGDAFVAYLNGPVPDDPVLRHRGSRCGRSATRARAGLVWQQRDLPRAAAADGLDVFFSPAYSCPLRLDVPRVTAVHDLSFFSWPSDFTLARRAAPPRHRGRQRPGVDRGARLLRLHRARDRRALSRRRRRASPTCPWAPTTTCPPPPIARAVRARRGLRGPLLLTVGAILNRRCLPTLLQAVALLRRQGFP